MPQTERKHIAQLDEWTTMTMELLAAESCCDAFICTQSTLPSKPQKPLGNRHCHRDVEYYVFNSHV